MNPKLEEATEAFFKALEISTEEERKEAISEIISYFCQYCGRAGEGECCCMRDD